MTTMNDETVGVTDAGEMAALAAVPAGLLIDGAWVDATDARTFGVEDPATGQILTQVADASVADAMRALDAADAAQAAWRTTAPRVRAEILRGAYQLMVDRADELALLMTLEMGKPLAESRAEVLYAADFLRWFSEEAVRIGGDYKVAPDGGSRLLVLRQAVGPCLLVTPWNFPLAMGTRKIGPALAAGCTVVIKPAKQTPLSMLALGAILVEAGVPAGVVNIVTTSDSRTVVAELMTDPRLRKLSFTGSTEVGITLMKQAADSLLRLSMELGGNAPFIVFEDADLDHAVDQAMLAKLRNNGEACTAANRFLVQETVAAPFAAKLAARFAQLRVGRGTEQGVGLGPLIDQPAVEKSASLVADAVDRGAQLLVGGRRPEGAGYFYPPTVVAGVPKDAAILHEEIFGPVAAITTFADEAEALAIANASPFGLASYVFTADLARSIRMIEGIESGMVAINRGVLSNAAAPFGGVKASGFGREGGDHGIDEYLEVKYASLPA